ncbi:uncharacterized protein N7459_002670 [Penicillium hispanicum]|uniref:uncharacterized protein n=1 Tax=Penicillium hispanicum TaxID=1080232 RepID=UPI00254105AC|nr:uncharacterized protein N7459_002670 [Penicillium hispanicum]KAJ5586905.1 hypothetical protein N7459_002670 [Penicillium hispanicum]
MLERAAGCFETAGRHFLRDPKSAIRTRRSLPRHFWKHSRTGGDAAHWFLALVQPPTQPASAVPKPLHESKGTNDRNPPFLDFLYPQKTQEFAVLRLSRHSKRPGLRRRRRTLAGFPRAYTSDALTLRPLGRGETSIYEARQQQNGLDVPKQSRADLNKLLRARRPDFDKAWVLYIAAGHPSDARSMLCRLLSKSKRGIDQDRAWQVFEELVPESRSADDFLNITQSLLHSDLQSSEKSLKLKLVCEQAISSGFADACCALSFAYHVKNNDWPSALEIWKLRAQALGDSNRPQPQTFLSRSPQWALPENALSLGGFIASQPDNLEAVHLAQFLLDHISKSTRLLGNTPMDVLLRILRAYRELCLLTGHHYFSIIESLQASDVRSVFVRSIVFYRHLRWQLPEEKPPRKLLTRQLNVVISFDIAGSIPFFLEEITHFYAKPSIESYKQAMYMLARSGDARRVNLIFDKLVADHGKPKSRRLVTPLLYVHAHIGNLQETLEQFRRVSEEFHLEQNTVCWNILLSAYVNTGDSEGALSTFLQMLGKGIQPDSYTLGILMGMCAKRGDIHGVRRLLKEAQDYKVRITMPMLDTIIHAYLNNGQLDLAEELAEACLSLNVEGSPMRMWNAILMQHAFRIDAESFHRVFARIQEAGLAPDAMTYAAVMLRMVLAGNPDMARMTLRRLHKRRVIHATEFHYAIVLLGYVKTRNRDMVHVIFREVAQRFDGPGMKSSLLRLRSAVQRDLDAVKQNGDLPALRFEEAEKFLLSSIAQFDLNSLSTKLSSRSPQAKLLRNAFFASHYEYLIQEYGARGAIEQASSLFHRYVEDGVNPPADPLRNENNFMQIRLVNAMMVAHLKAEQFEEVEQCWKLIFPRALKMASPIDFDELLISRSLESAPSERGSTESSAISLSDSSTRIDSRLANKYPDHSPRRKLKVLPSRRFDLSRPLSLYMRALAYQNEPDRIFQVVAEVEEAGFVLTTFNWSTFVQMLAASDRYSDLTEAFRIFEEKFMPNFSSWKRLKYGQGMKPPGVPRSVYMLEDRRRPEQSKRFLGKAARSYWSNIQPDFMQPTYVSMVYLAAALNRVREMSIMNGGNELENLYSTAPETVEVLGRLPYLRDKFQGVLVRHRSEQPEKERKPRRGEHFVASGGVLGSGSRSRRRRGIYHDQPLPSKSDALDPADDDLGEAPDNQSLEHDKLDMEIWGNPLPPEDRIDFEGQMRFHKSMRNRHANRHRAAMHRRRGDTSPVTRRAPKPMYPRESEISHEAPVEIDEDAAAVSKTLTGEAC